ncbi:MAG: hypothetical protein HKP27_02170 [Myxococcales bacterium]|nr:hypothetical protein [Myxococcales bacterium]
MDPVMIGQQPFATLPLEAGEVEVDPFVSALLAIDPFAGVHHPEFADYLPYMVPIGLAVLWYVRGLIVDWLRDFLRVRRRRFLKVIRSNGDVRRYGYWEHYLGEIGPCFGSPFYEPWQRWQSRYWVRKVEGTSAGSAPPLRKGA